MRRGWSVWVLGVLAGCPGAAIVEGADTDSDGSSGTTAMTPTTMQPGTTATTATPTTTAGSSSDGDTTESDTIEPDSGSGDDATTTGAPVACTDGSCAVDLVVVIDNSSSMAQEQAALARQVSLLEQQLRGQALDVQVMFTTTDFGNPLCTPFRPKGYAPASGAPITSACTGRLDDFTNLTGQTIAPEVCTDYCPSAVLPDDPFVAFNGDQDNVQQLPDVDIDGDGIPDSAAAQAMACLAPMGINGCGFESPLETMIQALNPGAAWNNGARPFLRDDAGITAVMIVTDEADCSVSDYAVMSDEDFMETNPLTGQPAATSAMCINAGIECSGLDENGVYTSGCTSAEPTALHRIDRYLDYLVGNLRDAQGKEVVMLGLLGVPTVTEHLPDSPFTPTAGGVDELVYREWIDGEYPAGDILPGEFANGTNALDKEFLLGIGPGCTGEDGAGGFVGQGIPPTRLREVCQALDLGDGPGQTRCCIESVCDADYTNATRCLSGLIGSVAQR